MTGKQRRKFTHKQLEKGSNAAISHAHTGARLAPHEAAAGSSKRDGGRSKVPAYRARPEYGQAIVTLTDSRSGARRDYWLGEIGSPESRERYYRALAAWESGGRTLPTFEECGLVRLRSHRHPFDDPLRRF